MKCAILFDMSISSFWECIASTVKPEYLVIPIFVYLLNILSYICLKTGNRRARANRITFICGIFPVIVFVIGCMGVYFADLDFIIDALRKE